MVLQYPHLYAMDLVLDYIKPSFGRVWYKLVDDIAPRKWKKNIITLDPNSRFKIYQAQVNFDRERNKRIKAKHREHKKSLDNSLRYEYSPLLSETSIRLIRLHPGASDDSITGEIVLSTLEDDTPFEALSYTWGDPTPTASIHLDGSRLPLAVNLESALRRLRYSNMSRMVWIDALCINQNDMQERQNQVLLMGQIYGASTSVMVWLGDDVHVSESAFSLLRLLSEATHRPDYIRCHPFFMGQVTSSKISLENSADWITLDRLFWSAWFTRVWIIQELVLAKKAIIYFDCHCVMWDEFHTAANCAFSIQMAGWNEISPDRVVVLWELYDTLRASSKPDLLSLLRSSRFNLATDPHDKIYGLLGIAEPTSLRPDYTSPVQELFIDVAKLLLKQTGYLFLSSVVDSKRTQVSGLPTWVPDWSTPPKAFELLRHRKGPPSASGDTEPKYQLSPSNSLTVSGAVMDSIAHMAPILYVRDRPKGKTVVQRVLFQGSSAYVLAFRLIAWERLALRLPSYPDGTEVSEAFHRTLDQDHGAQNLEDDRKAILTNLYAVFRRRHLRPGEKALGYKEPEAYRLDENNSSLAAAQYERQIWDVCTHRRLVVTRKGYLGLVPASTRHGDKIAMFLGGSTPYILRKARNGTYMFRGDCYVHGIMHGEALEKEHVIEDLVLR